MFNIGGTEFLVIFVVALIVLGPKRIPEVARYLGRAMKQFREAATEVKRNLHLDEMDDVRREMRDTWRSSRQLGRMEESQDKTVSPMNETQSPEEKSSPPPNQSGKEPDHED